MLEACHAEMMKAAGVLERLVEAVSADAVAALDRAAASAVVQFYGVTARRHHEDEERHVFPALLASGQADLVQAASQLRRELGFSVQPSVSDPTTWHIHLKLN